MYLHEEQNHHLWFPSRKMTKTAESFGFLSKWPLCQWVRLHLAELFCPIISTIWNMNLANCALIHYTAFTPLNLCFITFRELKVKQLKMKLHNSLRVPDSPAALPGVGRSGTCLHRHPTPTHKQETNSTSIHTPPANCPWHEHYPRLTRHHLKAPALKLTLYLAALPNERESVRDTERSR